MFSASRLIEAASLYSISLKCRPGRAVKLLSSFRFLELLLSSAERFHLIYVRAESSCGDFRLRGYRYSVFTVCLSYTSADISSLCSPITAGSGGVSRLCPLPPILFSTMTTDSSLLSGAIQVVVALPFYGIVVFCCYSLAVVGHGLITFPECPTAQSELRKDIERAKTGLRAKGVCLDTLN